jgi:archaellum component FlaF (FlaF/FlaG flagellin family)
MKKILSIGLIILFLILPAFACAVNAESNTNEIKIYDAPSTSNDNQTELVVKSVLGGAREIVVNIMNNGTTVANDVFIKIIVTGGLFNRVNRSHAWGVIYIPANGIIAISVKHFFGLGKITIVVVARALNAPDVSKTTIGFLLGPFTYIAK